jgi:molybdopterin-guanine dinucleotide biosynthesis protein A
MGTDKALLDLGGRTFVEHIHAALSLITTHTSIVGAPHNCATWPQLPAVPDVHIKWGALGGLHAALTAARAPWAIIVACDLPFVTGELFVRLASFLENFDAVVPVQPDGRVQPLCALYRAEVCAERARELIASGERRPRALLPLVKTRQVSFGELSDLEGANRFFANINTPDDYNYAKEEIK